jgi:hypothetical protein
MDENRKVSSFKPSRNLAVSLRYALAFALCLNGFVAPLRADIFVPADYPTIQSAINAASPGEVIHIAAGRYAETLTISKGLTLSGSGTNNCVVYSSTNVPLISIVGPGTVTLSNFEINGGSYFAGFYNGTSPIGVTATNANLVLDSVVVNQFINYMITVVDGTIAATNVALWTRDLLVQCDIGLQLSGCTGVVSRLAQDGGRIDHIVNINGVSNHRSDLTIENSRIRTSSGSYGNCIRTYVNSSVRITTCYLYRAAVDTVPAYPAFNHSAISVNGYSNTVVIAGNTISNAPWALYLYGSPGIGGNQILVESNTILNSTIGGFVWDGMNYKGVDLGGGAFGSFGGNAFSEAPAPPPTYRYDVLFTNSSAYSSANIFALHNTWSNPTNKESVIYDKLDNPNFGRLITDDLIIKTSSLDAARRPVISWTERGAGEKYTVEFCNGLAAPAWTAAPGTWPVTNSGLGDMMWTNPSPVSSNILFRIRSVVP